jgi:serine/threonine-protein kinase
VARVLAGRYELEALLGRGSSGGVWRARDITTRRVVAVKIIELAAIDDPVGIAETVARFRREAAILTRLRHPNVVSATEATQVGNELFMVMEMADGVSLASRLQQRADNDWGLFPVRDALRIAGQACAGLAAAHAQGIVHRDVKPSNLMVSARLDVKVIDFGIARLLADKDRITDPSTALGTVAYMSPEQAEGRIDIDGRSDLYSLGCVLYELLAGRRPFTADDPRTLMLMQDTADADPLGSIRPDLPAALCELAGALLMKDRTARPQDAARVLGEIEAISARAASGEPQREADRETYRGPAFAGVVPGVVAGAATEPGRPPWQSPGREPTPRPAQQPQRPVQRGPLRGPRWKGFLRSLTALAARAGSRGQGRRLRPVAQLGRHRLDLGVGLQDLVAHLAAPAGLLVPAERQRRVEHVVAVDPHRAGPQLLGQGVRLGDVLGPDAGPQAVLWRSPRRPRRPRRTAAPGRTAGSRRRSTGRG